MEKKLTRCVAAGCRGWALELLACRAYRAHTRNLHLRASLALSLHSVEKKENKKNSSLLKVTARLKVR